MLGGRLLHPNTADPDERKLLNVVEEMAIASGVPVPQVYVMDEEPGINAFAAGFSPSDAVISVTHGGLKLLKRDELQGVLGHEFSHILN
ncbi:MAG: peptidase M48, partial [Verrucomicrobia bacterium]